MTTWERVIKLEEVFKLEETRMKWVPVVAEMGTVPDRVIAKKLSCASEYVAQVRQKMGIAPKKLSEALQEIRRPVPGAQAGCFNG